MIDQDKLFDILYQNVMFNTYSLENIWKIGRLLRKEFPESNVFCDQGINKDPYYFPTFKNVFYVSCIHGFIYEFAKVATYKDSKFDVINNMRKNNFKLTVYDVPSACPNYWLFTPY
jgi:hypothetical protein